MNSVIYSETVIHYEKTQSSLVRARQSARGHCRRIDAVAISAAADARFFNAGYQRCARRRRRAFVRLARRRRHRHLKKSISSARVIHFRYR